MARFIGYLKGSRGMVSRLGHARSGLRATVNGWDIGVEVHAHPDAEDRDVFDVYWTNGSNGGRSAVLIAIVREGQGPIQCPVAPGIQFPEAPEATATDLERRLFDVLLKIEAAWSNNEDAKALYWADVRAAIDAAEAMG